MEVPDLFWGVLEVVGVVQSDGKDLINFPFVLPLNFDGWGRVKMLPC